MEEAETRRAPDIGGVEEVIDTLREQVDQLVQARPLAALAIAARLEQMARTVGGQAAAAATANGDSWSDIGAAYGISKQAAHQRFARQVQKIREQRR